MKTPPPFTLFLSIAAVLALPAICAFAQTAPAAAPYKILATTQIPAAGGIDYIAADSVNRRVYSASGNVVSVFDLDTYKLVGSLPNASGHGVALDPENHTGLVSGNPTRSFLTPRPSSRLKRCRPAVRTAISSMLLPTTSLFSATARPTSTSLIPRTVPIVGTVDAIGPNGCQRRSRARCHGRSGQSIFRRRRSRLHRRGGRQNLQSNRGIMTWALGRRAGGFGH